MLMARPPASNMMVVQAYKRQMEQMVTRGYAKQPKVGKRTRAPEEGNLFPMTAQEYKGRRLTQENHQSYKSEQAAASLHGGATTMPPIFMETKIMIV